MTETLRREWAALTDLVWAYLCLSPSHGPVVMPGHTDVPSASLAHGSASRLLRDGPLFRPLFRRMPWMVQWSSKIINWPLFQSASSMGGNKLMVMKAYHRQFRCECDGLCVPVSQRHPAVAASPRTVRCQLSELQHILMLRAAHPHHHPRPSRQIRRGAFSLSYVAVTLTLAEDRERGRYCVRFVKKCFMCWMAVMTFIVLLLSACQPSR